MCEYLEGNTCQIDKDYCIVPKDGACLKRVTYKANDDPQAAPKAGSECMKLLSAGSFEAYGDLFTAAFKQLEAGDGYKAAQILERVAGRIRYDESLKSELGI